MMETFKIRSISDGSAWGCPPSAPLGRVRRSSRVRGRERRLEGPTRIKKCTHAVSLIAGLLTMFAAAASAAPEKYQAYLSPMPHNDATLDNLRGKGTATITLDGETISIAGTFAGLSSPATTARLLLSAGPGIPGKTVVKDVEVTTDVSGKVSGQVKLDAAQ